MEGPKKSVLASVKGLQENGEYSDLAIVCGSKVFNVHKAVMCPQSKFIEAACKKGFKEGAESKIVLPECKSMADFQDGDLEYAVYSMIRFCYGSSDYATPTDQKPIQWLAVLYVTADRYGIANMKEDLVIKFRDEISQIPNVNVTPTEEQIETLRGIPKLITFLYHNLPANDVRFKQVIVAWLATTANCLLFSGVMDNLMEQIPSFSVDLLRKNFFQPSNNGDLLAEK